MIIPKAAKTEAENESFWERHGAEQSRSGLSKLTYCREKQIDYSRFQYWLKRNKQPIIKKPLIEFS